MSENRVTPADRVRGCLLGGAVGDALGAPVEFMSLDEIRRRFGPKGVSGYEPAYGRRGAITDDTQMTLWTAEGLIRADNRMLDRGMCRPEVVVWGAYQRWLATQGQAGRDWITKGPIDPDSEWIGWLFGQDFLPQQRAPGRTCLSALQSGKLGTPTEPINNSKGCGGVMRVAPVGLVAADPFDMGCNLAALTHGHPTGYLAAGAFALIIRDLFRGSSLRDAITHARTVLAGQKEAEETIAAIDGALRAADTLPPTAESVERLGAGWIAEEALAIALFCALVADGFRSGVLLAVNHSGDTDSTGSLTGQLLGVQGGVGVIPGEWLDELEGRDVIEQVAEDLIAHFISPPGPAREVGAGTTSAPDDMDRYPPN
jgi:ADP-ribosylglycohydrolase